MNIRVLREAGSWGDNLRVLPVCRGLRERWPASTIWVYTLDATTWIYEHCPHVHRIVRVPKPRRRQRSSVPDPKRARNRYLDPHRQGLKHFDLTVDCYCPGLDHEIATRGNVTMDRIEAFCRGPWYGPDNKRVEHEPLTPSSYLPDYRVRPEERDSAWAWLVESANVSDGGLRIAVAPQTQGVERRWARIGWIAGLRALLEDGCHVIILDSHAGRVRDLPGTHCIGRSGPFVAALLAQCDLLLTLDTGPMHLAAAVGTPAVVLAAAMDGHVLCKHYPNHHVVSPPADAANPRGCDWPCNVRPERGRSAECREQGCAMMRQIQPGHVLEALAKAVHVPRSRDRADNAGALLATHSGGGES